MTNNQYNEYISKIIKNKKHAKYIQKKIFDPILIMLE